MNAIVVKKQVDRYLKWMRKNGLRHPEEILVVTTCKFSQNGRIHTARLEGTRWVCAATRNNFSGAIALKIETRLNGWVAPLFA